MSLTITADAMTSEVTSHTAQRVDAVLDAWTVTWLGGITLDHNQAITAMTLAESVAAGVTTSHKDWPLVVGWANELGVAAAWAVKRIQETAGQS